MQGSAQRGACEVLLAAWRSARNIPLHFCAGADAKVKTHGEVDTKDTSDVVLLRAPCRDDAIRQCSRIWKSATRMKLDRSVRMPATHDMQHTISSTCSRREPLAGLCMHSARYRGACMEHSTCAVVSPR